MPQKVQKKKKNINIGIAIFTIIFTLIPVIIISFTGRSSFRTPYGIYSLSMLGICIYFSCVFGMFAWKNKILYIVLDAINIVASLGLLIYAYINYSYQGGLLLHIAAALLFIFGMYQTGDTDQGDNFIFRYLVPIVLDIAGLIFVLWFISVKMNVIAHIVIVSIINFFTLSIFLIPSLVKLFFRGNQFFDNINSEQVEYEDETEEEIAAKKEAKRAMNDAKKQQDHYEKSRKEGRLSANTGIWLPYPSNIDHIWKNIVEQYNRVIDETNYAIRNNNQDIRHSSSSEIVKMAGDSNKDIKKCVRYFKRNLKGIEKNLEKLQKKEFTSKDKYKSFSYNLISGRMKRKKSNNEYPTLWVNRCQVYYKYKTRYHYTSTVEIDFKAEEVYLKKY